VTELIQSQSPTTALQRLRSWAIDPLHLSPDAPHYLYVCYEVVLQGILQSSSCPLGSMSNAGCYLLSIWPIQPTHFLFISISMGPCFVCCQSSKLLMVSGQGILRVCGRQLFMKVWTFLVVFFVVLSDPYSKTDFTFELKIPILVWVAISWLSICF